MQCVDVDDKTFIVGNKLGEVLLKIYYRRGKLARLMRS